MLSRCGRQTVSWRAGQRLTRRNNCIQSPWTLLSQQNQHVLPPSTRSISIPSSSIPASRKQNGNSKRWQIVALSTCAALGIAFALLRNTQYLDLGSTTPEHKFAPYELVGREPVSSTLSIFNLRMPTPDNKRAASFHEAWKTGIWNVLFKQPQIQVVRAYTPLPPSPADHDQDVKFLIRHDPRGEVSSWLHRLPIGTNIEMKGPNLELDIPPSTRNITFLAGGTGIAPALQAAHALLSRSTDDAPADADCLPSIHILWASRQREDCLGGVSDTPHEETTSKLNLLRRLFSRTTDPSKQEQWLADNINGKGLVVQQLDALKAKYPRQVKVDYFVDEENTFIREETVARSVSVTCPLVIVSGPEGFINYFAGPKVWRGGREQQGPVGGVVAQALARLKRKTASTPGGQAAPIKVWKV